MKGTLDPFRRLLMTQTRFALGRTSIRIARVLMPIALLASSGLATLPAVAATASAAGPLSVTISAPDSGVQGTAVPFSVAVTNTTANSTTLLSQLDIDLPLDAPFTGGITNSTGGACSRRDTTAICFLAGIPAGGSATVAFSAVPQDAGTLTATASAAFAVSIAQASLEVAIAPAPTDIQVTGAASTGSPAVGSTYSYTFQIKDNGPWAAPGVTFSDTLPSAVSLAGVISTAGTCSVAGATISCNPGDLPVGAQANVTLTVQAPATPQTFTDTASVSMADSDRQPANNSVGVTVQVR
jgi:uncharacterized repeat protein (TIGR01451 family)